MSFFQWLAGGRTRSRRADFEASVMHSRLDSGGMQEADPSQSSALGEIDSALPANATGRHTLRKNLIRMVLRDIMFKTGVPPDWIGAEVLIASSRKRPAGVYLRLLIRSWDDQLMQHMMGLQRAIEQRLMALDPTSAEWLAGISWQFSLQEDVKPAPLPHPASWTQRQGFVATLPGGTPMFR